MKIMILSAFAIILICLSMIVAIVWVFKFCRHLANKELEILNLKEEIKLLKSEEKEVCRSCGETVKMISSGEFCPVCYCD
jgi:hypothetical protein